MQLSDKNIGSWLEYWADKTPDGDCLIYADKDIRLSWAQFNLKVDELAKGLIAIGVRKNSHVGIWAKNIPDWLTVFFACAKIGAVSVTLNTGYKAREFAYVLGNSDLHTLFFAYGTPGNNFVEMVNSVIPELKNTEPGKLSSTRFHKLKNVVYMGEERFRGMFNLQDMVHYSSTISESVFLSEKASVNAHEVINIQYTSGDTYFPKGVMLTHFNIVNNGFITGEHLHFNANDRLCICVPLFHCFGLVLAVMNCLTHGSAMVMLERFDPLLTLATIHKERCTALYGVPTMFRTELDHPMFDIFDLSSLNKGIMAGTFCPPELMKKVENKMNMPITSVYGLTETSPGITQSLPEDEEDVRWFTVGRVYEYIDVKIVNSSTGELCPDGIEGEICCRGINLMKGYYNNIEATRAVFDDEGFLHTGDLGIKDSKGNYKITGRLKDMIIRGGENISPKEIEDFLFHMPGVKNALVVAVPSPKYGEDVGVFIVQHEGAGLTEEDVLDFCKNQISRTKIPRYVFFIDEFPVSQSGKVGKLVLQEFALRLCKEQNIEIV